MAGRNADNSKDSKVWEPLAAAKSLQSCPTLCVPIDSSPPGSPVPAILQARTLRNEDLRHISLQQKSDDSPRLLRREKTNCRVDVHLSLGGAISLNFAPVFSLKFKMKI